MPLLPLDELALRERLPRAITQTAVKALLPSFSLQFATEQDAELSEEQRLELAHAWSRTQATGAPIAMVVFTEDDDGREYPDSVLARFVAADFAPVSRAAGAPSTSWLVGGYLARAPSGEVIVRELEFEALDDEHAPVTGTVLRAFRVDDLIARALARLQAHPDVLNVLERHGLYVASDEERLRAEQAAQLAAAHDRRRGRVGFPESHYRRVALDYLKLVDSGIKRGVRNQLAERYGVSPKTVGDWIHRAGELEFLGPGRQGRAGREPGPRLYADTRPPLGHSGTTREAARSRKAVQAAARRR